jgi:hypothetical protein
MQSSRQHTAFIVLLAPLLLLLMYTPSLLCVCQG